MKDDPVEVLASAVLTPWPVCAYGAVRDPLVVAVLLSPPQFLRQLCAIEVGMQLRYGAQHDHLK